MADLPVQDQVDGVRWLVDQELADPQRIGNFGWSGGGYMTLQCLTRASEVFAAGVAGAPVTNFDGYDNHYTGRYMGDPGDGEGRYERSSPITYAGELRDPLLIVHGMADDNVFFDNTVQMIDALQKAGKPFEMMTYPGKRHRVARPAEKVHLLTLFKARRRGR